MNAFRIYNAGYPGDTTLELLNRFDRDVAARLPDLVCLLVGGNDMFYPGHILEIESYRTNLEELLGKIETIGARTILFTVPLFYRPFLIENFPETIEHPLSTAERLNLVNHAIRTAARKHSIPLIDLAEVIRPVDDSAASLVMNETNSGRRDGMHLTAAGLQVMAEAVYAVWKSDFPAARTIVCFGDSITYGVYMKGKGTAEPDALTYPGQLAKKILENEC